MNKSKSTEPTKYPWYESGNWDKLEQGDLLVNCPVLVQSAELAPKLLNVVKNIQTDIPIGVQLFDLIIMSQSCDLAHDKIDQVLLCAYFPASNQSRDNRKAIRREHRPALHMIEKCELKGHEFEQQIVDFRTIYTLPKGFVLEFAKQLKSRVRLLPPYKEHLSQAFARYFMRVGLPRPLAED